MSHKTRIQKLEQVHGVTEKIQYICILYPDNPEIIARRMDQTGEPIQFADRAALDEFENRPDIELLIVEIHYASEGDLNTDNNLQQE